MTDITRPNVHPSTPTPSQRSVLMFALQFPPFSQSTGRLRTLSFVRHLPAHGWTPLVVTARAEVYPETDPATLKDIPAQAHVVRAWGLDIARAVSIRGVYPRWLATPDRWAPWIAGAAWAGWATAKRHRPHAIWATFPIPSALLAALLLHKVSGIPLIADLRDPLVYESWPVHRWDRHVYRWLERKVVRAASAVVVTTPGAAAMYRSRYPEYDSGKFHVIANGIEDASPDSVPEPSVDDASKTITLVHSGVMEMPDRSPLAFFDALRLMRERGQLPKRALRIVLRGAGSEESYAEAARMRGVDSIVQLLPHVSRGQAMKEVAAASALLLFQGPECNRQIPAKAYEYLASGKPIIGLMHPDGDTHALVQGGWGVPYAADMNSPQHISSMLTRFFSDLEQDCAYVPPASLHVQYMRRTRASELARLLDTITERVPLQRLDAVELKNE